MFNKLFGHQNNINNANNARNKSHKVFVLGLDGARLEFVNRPELPNFQKIIQNGASGTLFSRPALTPAAWTSMVTGKNPGKHGIFDFRIGDQLLSSLDKKAKELWDYVPSVAINVPMTYPAKKIDGLMITGMMSPDLDSEMVYPESERQYLKQLDYVIEADQTLESIEDSIKKRIQMVKHYYDRDWELFFIVFREYDVLHHFFWGQDLAYYKMMDDFLGDYLLPRLEEEEVKLAIVSDHGFAHVDKTVNIGKFLEEHQFDKYYSVGGWGALYKTEKLIEDTEKRTEIIDALKNYEHEGQKILDVFKNEEIYWGPYADQGPDLLVWPKRELGYTFAMRSDTVVASSDHKNGCHLEHGMVILHGFETTSNQLDANIKDIFPTVMSALGQTIDHDVDGEIIR